MMGGKLQSQRIQQSSPFFGIRFLLSGFDPLHHQQVKSKLVSVGAVDVGQYGPDCTHVIVHNLVFDDRICAIARRDGKTLVTNLWVDHSLDAGEPVDATSIMYRPPKDLNGIPGAEELVMCLTGYQRQDREDIMTMVGLMGAEFSKPLVANRVTHLICYKFEGEKYELAKKMRKIKLVNHQWLEDCLKAWKIQPEEDYSKSGYELEMVAEAKDSEEETGEMAAKLTEGSNINVIPSLQNEIGETKDHSVISNKVSSLSAQQGLPVVSTNDHMKFQIKEEMKSAQASKSRSQNKMDQQSPRRYRTPDKMDAKSDSMYAENVRFLPSKQIANELPSMSGDAKNSVDFEPTKFSNLSGSRKTPEKKSSLPLHVGEDLGNISRESSKRLADSDTGMCSPLGSRKSPRRQTTGNLVNSNARIEENLTERVIDVMCKSYREPDKEKWASARVGVPSPEQISSSNSSKHSPPSSRRTPRRSSLSMQTARKLDNSDGKTARKFS